jgi:hypothetical protein
MDNVWTTRFSYLLADIESGRMAAAIPTLAGMFDAIADDHSAVLQCRSDLLSHPIHSALESSSAKTSIAEIGFCRAQRARDELAASLILSCEKARLNIGGPDEQANAKSCAPDIIIAPALADSHCAAILTKLVHRLLGQMEPGGRLVLSAFTPRHLGLGWRRIVLGEDVHCHDETAFTTLASALDLAPTLFRDGSGNLIWAEFSRKHQNHNEGKNYGYRDPYPSHCRRRSASVHTALSAPATPDAGLCRRVAGGRLSGC